MKPMNTELATRQVIDDLERVMDELKTFLHIASRQMLRWKLLKWKWIGLSNYTNQSCSYKMGCVMEVWL